MNAKSFHKAAEIKGCVLATLTMTGSREPKPGQALKRLGPHDLVTPVPQFENRVFHLVLSPGQQSLAGGKKEPILDGDFYENTFVKIES